MVLQTCTFLHIAILKFVCVIILQYLNYVLVVLSRGLTVWYFCLLYTSDAADE